MAFFQRKPQVSDNLPLYTLGGQSWQLVIGLGNPGKTYAGSRHNIGWEALEVFANSNDFPGWVVKKDLNCRLSTHAVGDKQVVLCQPTTFMNLSGQAAQAVQRFYQVSNSQTLVVYDELALPFGQLRTRPGGSSAGHNGVKSLIEHLGPDFDRLRIGIGSERSEKANDADFVLAKFSKEEQAQLALILRETNSLITEWLVSDTLAPSTRNIF